MKKILVLFAVAFAIGCNWGSSGCPNCDCDAADCCESGACSVADCGCPCSKDSGQ